MDAVPPRDDGRFAAFRNGRGHVHAIGPPHEEDRDLHITTEGLGNYSTSFYLDDERRRDVVDLMKRVRPKQPYLDAADRIVTGLRAYNAIHVRRGDFMTNADPPADLPRRNGHRAGDTWATSPTAWTGRSRW